MAAVSLQVFSAWWRKLALAGRVVAARARGARLFLVRLFSVAFVAVVCHIGHPKRPGVLYGEGGNNLKKFLIYLRYINFIVKNSLCVLDKYYFHYKII